MRVFRERIGIDAGWGLEMRMSWGLVGDVRGRDAFRRGACVCAQVLINLLRTKLRGKLSVTNAINGTHLVCKVRARDTLDDAVKR